MSDAPPPPDPSEPHISWAKKRLPYEVEPSPLRSGNRAKFLLFALLTVGFAALAGYMSLVQQHPLTSGYVVAPGIGALWFGLRIFMMLTPKVDKKL